MSTHIIVIGATSIAHEVAVCLVRQVVSPVTLLINDDRDGSGFKPSTPTNNGHRLSIKSMKNYLQEFPKSSIARIVFAFDCSHEIIACLTDKDIIVHWSGRRNDSNVPSLSFEVIFRPDRLALSTDNEEDETKSLARQRTISFLFSGFSESRSSFVDLCSLMTTSDETGVTLQELTFVGGVGSDKIVKQVHHAILECETEIFLETFQVLCRCGELSRGEIIQIFCRWRNADSVDGWMDYFLYRLARGSNEDSISSELHQYCNAILSDHSCPHQFTSLISAAQFSNSCRADCTVCDSSDAEHTGSFFSPDETPKVNPQQIILDLQQALKASRIILYSQGIAILRHLSSLYDIEINQALQHWKAIGVLNQSLLELVETTVELNDKESQSLLQRQCVARLIFPSINPLRRINTLSIACGLAVPVLAASMTLCDIHARTQYHCGDVDVSEMLTAL